MTPALVLTRGMGHLGTVPQHVITTEASTGAVTQQEEVHERDAYFRYDAMNRQTVANARADGTLGEDGHRITYDWLGNKTSDSWQGRVISVKPGTSYTVQRWGHNDTYSDTTVIATTYQAQLGETSERYGYDALGRLKTIERDGTQVETRAYDAGGRIVEAGAQPNALSADYLSALYGSYEGSNQPLAGNGTELKRSVYDAHGRLLHQQVLDNAGERLYELNYRSAGDPATADYDGAGNLRGYKLHNIKSPGYTNTYTYGYLQAEGYKEASVTVARGDQTSGTWTKYDGNGHVVRTNDMGQAGSERIFVNDESGRAVYVRQGSHVQRQLVVNGEVLGRWGEVVDESKPKTASAPSFTTV